MKSYKKRRQKKDYLMEKVIMQMAPQLLKSNQSKPDKEFNQREKKSVRKRTVKENTQTSTKTIKSS